MRTCSKGVEVIKTKIEGPLIFQPKVFGDDRGYFIETYNEKVLDALGFDVKFVQDNESMSAKGIMRGLHFQAPPFAQGKLVRVVRGAVIDVAVDIRKSSPTYGEHFKVELSDQNHTMIWIPEGFAHGFFTLEDHTIFSYKCTRYYNKESEGGILWNDRDLGIDWGIEEAILSDKDMNNPQFRDFKSPFE